MVMMLVMMMLMMMMLMMVMMMRGGMLRMGWYSQGHKFGLIDGNRWEQPWAQSGLPAQNTALVLCICICVCTFQSCSKHRTRNVLH